MYHLTRLFLHSFREAACLRARLAPQAAHLFDFLSAIASRRADGTFGVESLAARSGVAKEN